MPDWESVCKVVTYLFGAFVILSLKGLKIRSLGKLLLK